MTGDATLAADTTEDKPTVSVIMPTFNRAHLISESLESLLAQTYPISEILVVDDGSTDDTKSVVDGFGDKVRYVRQENGGKNSAINTGLDIVRGDLVWIMDDDDLAPTDALERLAAPFVSDPSTMVTYGALQKFHVDADSGEHVPQYTPPFPAEDGRSFFIQMMEDCFITGQPCVLVRRSAYEAISPLPADIVISEDYAVWLELSRKFDATRVEGTVLLQRQHEGPRGPASIRYAAASRNTRWSAADTELINNLLQDVSLGELYARDAVTAEMGPVERRHALLQKAVIAGRKKLWPLAVSSIREAVAEAPSIALSPAEMHVLKQMLGCRYGLDELIEAPEILDQLRAAFGPLEARRSAINAIASFLPYLIRLRLKEGDHKRALAMWKLYWRLTGVRQGVGLWANVTLSKLLPA